MEKKSIETINVYYKQAESGRLLPILVAMTSITTLIINLLLTEREGRTGEYWPEVVTVRTERSEVRTKTTEGQYSPVRLQQARVVSSLLYGIVFLGEETLPVISFIYNTSFKTFFILLLKMLLKPITYMTFTAKYQESAHSREGKSHK